MESKANVTESGEFHKGGDNREYLFTLSDRERDSLYSDLASVSGNPYENYHEFVTAIRELVASSRSFDVLRKIASQISECRPEDSPFVFGRNCPIDKNLPILDWENPVEDKKLNKTTYISEGFLAAMSILLVKPAIAHRSVNNGDFFHDIAPKKSMTESQSQKTLGTLKFHKDFTNHFAQPDFVLQVVLRNNPINEVYSTYVSNKEMIKRLDSDLIDELRREKFYTPYDDISTKESTALSGKAKNHSIVEENFRFRFFEGRTVGLDEKASSAVDQLITLMHHTKVRNIPRPGDFVLLRNHYCLHGKEVDSVSDPLELQNRWIMKTHNVEDISKFEKFFETASYGVVNG
ncbi:hypothetical protein [Burkholderia sp. LMG 21824]|uniref:hypothetical protein n=1 Tax=Burkholderia sp. LMG 21824 TaxID=3158172 RepID=UPI003C2E5DD8